MSLISRHRSYGESARVQVTSAHPLSLGLRKSLEEKLRLTVRGNLRVDYRLDPGIIGGLVIRIGDQVLDGSIRRRIEELRLRLKQNRCAGSAVDLKEIIRSLASEVEGFGPAVYVDNIGTVVSIGDGVAHVRGLDKALAGELVEFPSGAMGMVMDLDIDRVGCIVFGGMEDIQEGDLVRSTGEVADVPVGPALIGRVVDALGRPLDNKGPIIVKKRRPIESPAPGVAEREPVREPLYTGWKVIDALIPIGKGQRELIIGDRQTGKTSIALDTVLDQRTSGVICVYAFIGQKASTVAQLVKVLEDHGAMDYTTVVVATASDPTAFQYIAPYTACAIAEEFMYSGKDVLVVYDDLSKHAAAYRELSLLLRRPPGREAYPGDIFYIHGRLLERAGKLSKALGGGSMTALPIVETLAGDISAYIPTNVISITDGQIFLESDLFFAGNRPAINVGLSVSRVGGDAQIPAMKEVGGKLRLELAQYRELSSFAQFGADLDRATREQLARGERLMEILKQELHSPMPIEEQVVLLQAASAGAIDGVPQSEIAWFGREFVVYVKENYPGVLRSIRETGELGEFRADLRSAIDQFKRDFLVRLGEASGDKGPSPEEGEASVDAES